MAVVARRVTGGTHIADDLAARHALAGAYRQAGAVGVQSGHAVAVVDLHIVAPAVMPAGFHHGAAVAGVDGGAP